MGWKSKKKKRNNLRELQLSQIKNEISYLKHILYLPEDIVREIKSFLKLDVLNLISPLQDLHNPEFLEYNRYWLNFHIYFWICFIKRGEKNRKEITKYYQNIQNIKYIKYKKKIYNINDNSFVRVMEKYVKKDIKKFNYEGDQYNANIRERMGIMYSEKVIEKIIA